jgi:3-isopropylmalate dehydrogenase
MYNNIGYVCVTRYYFLLGFEKTSMVKKIALIKGDGIGPEIVNGAVTVLEKIAAKYSHTFEYTDLLMGGIAIDNTGVPLPKETVEIALASDAVLLGAVGGPKWDTLPGKLRPEAGMLGIRAALGLFANLRPVKIFPQLKDASPIKNSDGVDIMTVRELTGGAYFGERKTATENGIKFAYDTMKYSDYEIQRVARVAFETARKRRNLVYSIDKANVLDSSRLWREVVHEVHKEYADVELRDMLVDNAAMQLIRNPSQFDVIVTENLFGDILSDESSMLTGSLGMLPSASLGTGTLGLYEPIHGSAPDIAGRDIANPLATILSAGMLLRYSFGLVAEADAIDAAVDGVLTDGYRTADIASGGDTVGCADMSKRVAERV